MGEFICSDFELHMIKTQHIYIYIFFTFPNPAETEEHALQSKFYLSVLSPPLGGQRVVWMKFLLFGEKKLIIIFHITLKHLQTLKWMMCRTDAVGWDDKLIYF